MIYLPNIIFSDNRPRKDYYKYRLSKEIKRCLFLCEVIHDFGPDYEETFRVLFQDILDAVAAKDEGNLEKVAQSLATLYSWK